jgi:hypothetical protein
MQVYQHIDLFWGQIGCKATDFIPQDDELLTTHHFRPDQFQGSDVLV